MPVPVLTVTSSTGQTTVVANSTHAGEDGTVISGIEISFSIHHTDKQTFMWKIPMVKLYYVALKSPGFEAK